MVYYSRERFGQMALRGSRSVLFHPTDPLNTCSVRTRVRALSGITPTIVRSDLFIST